MAQSAVAAEYIDCISVEDEDSPNECPDYDTKQSDAEAYVMLELWGMQSSHLLERNKWLLCISNSSLE